MGVIKYSPEIFGWNALSAEIPGSGAQGGLGYRSGWRVRGLQRGVYKERRYVEMGKDKER